MKPDVAADKARSLVRLAIVVTHPIQYFSHVYRRLSAYPDLDVRVFYGSRIGLERYHDPGFGVELAWDCDLLGGFGYEFPDGADGVKRLDWPSLAKVKIVESLVRFDPDAVLLHGYSHPHVLRAWKWASSRGKRTILFGDGNGRSELVRPWARRVLKRIALAPVLRNVDRVLSLGEANELYWKTLGVRGSRVQWAPLYQPAPEVALAVGEERDHARKAVRSELGLCERDVLVVFSGKMVPWKRPQDLVRAIDNSKGLVGLYVGDGLCRQACEAVAKSTRHRFVGFANVPQLARYYAAGDLLCHPSEREPYGLVVAEAAAAALPVVASRVVGAIGTRSHGQPGRNAITFEPRDVESLSSILQSLAEDPGRRCTMARESFAVCAEMERACFDGLRACLFSP